MTEVAPSYSITVDEPQLSGVPNEAPIIVASLAPKQSASVKGMFGLGVAQIILGTISIVAHSLSFIDYVGWNIYLSGIWCGIMFIICGMFGVIPDTACKPCRVGTFLVLNILNAAIFSDVGIILAVFGIIDTSISYYPPPVALEMFSIVLTASLAEFTISIVCCCLSGYVLCCAPKPRVGPIQDSSQYQVVRVMPQSHTNYQMVAVPYNVQGQPMATAPASNPALPAQQIMVAQQKPMQ